MHAPWQTAHGTHDKDAAGLQNAMYFRERLLSILPNQAMKAGTVIDQLHRHVGDGRHVPDIALSETGARHARVCFASPFDRSRGNVDAPIAQTKALEDAGRSTIAASDFEYSCPTWRKTAKPRQMVKCRAGLPQRSAVLVTCPSRSTIGAQLPVSGVETARHPRLCKVFLPDPDRMLALQVIRGGHFLILPEFPKCTICFPKEFVKATGFSNTPILNDDDPIYPCDTG
jgi:hypothetical protein